MALLIFIQPWDSIDTADMLFKLANPFNHIINPLAHWIAKKISLPRNASIALSLCCASMLVLAACILVCLPSNLTLIGCIVILAIVKLAKSDWTNRQDAATIANLLSIKVFSWAWVASGLKVMLLACCAFLAYVATSLFHKFLTILPQSIKTASSSLASAIFADDDPVLDNVADKMFCWQLINLTYTLVALMIPIQEYTQEVTIIKKLLQSY